MKSDVKIRKYEKCQKNEMTQCHTRMPPMITERPTTVFQKCSFDIIGPSCPSGSQHRYIPTAQDNLSKFPVTVPLEDQTAGQVAKSFVDHVVLTCGIPQDILSDCGSQFLSETCKDVCKLLGINCIQSTSFRPQSNGSNGRSAQIPCPVP